MPDDVGLNDAVMDCLPVALVPRGNRWYLIGYDLARGWRVLRVDRITRAEPTGRRFSAREIPGGDPATFLASRLGAPPRTYTATILIHAPIDQVQAYMGGFATDFSATSRESGEPATLWRVADARLEILAGGLLWVRWLFEVLDAPELAALLEERAQAFASAASAEGQWKPAFAMSRVEIDFANGPDSRSVAPTIEEDHVATQTPRPFRRAVLAASLVLGCALVSGCGGPGTGPVEIDANPDKPVVLEGVSNVTEIAKLTGPDAMNDTETAAVAGTDLGSMANIGEKTFFFFGDTFGDRDPDSIGGQGGSWRSNVSAWTTDDDPSDGITFDGWAPADDIGWAEALVEGDHDANTGTGEVTKIPTHGFAVGETLYISYMSVSFWGEPGAWDANHARLAKSTDAGETWEPLDSPEWPGDSNFIQVAPALVKDGGTDYLYFWAIPSGRFGGVQLMRVPATEESVENQSAYTYFAGVDGDGTPRWSDDMAAAETVVEGTIGELSVMWSTYLERWIMTYSDGGNAYIREGITPWGPWGDPVELVSRAEYPGLYSPYMNPRYVSDDGRTIYFTLSLWDPYNVFWFSADLEKSS